MVVRAVFLSSRQPANAVAKWTSLLQTAGASVNHVALWSGPGDLGWRKDFSTCNVDSFLLGTGVTVESHLAKYAGGSGLLLVSVDLEQQHLPRGGIVLVVWQPQVPQDIVQTCLAVPASLADGSAVKCILLVDASPSLTLSVTHKALETAGLHGLARRPTLLTPRAAPAAVQALTQLAESLPDVILPRFDMAHVPSGVRIAVARDDAFGPCFQENLVLLHQAGAQLQFFSPLYDSCIPSGVAALYLSSGPLEPERWQQLASNRPLLAAIRAFADVGGLVLAEGAGLLYLSRTVYLDEDDGGHRHCVHDMAGVLPLKARLLPEAQTAAVHINVSPGNPLFPAGSQPRGYMCSHASIVLVEERPLAGLALGLHSKGGPLGGKGNSGSHLSTTYEVTVALRDGLVAEAGSAPLPEGYTVQNVLASNCFVYLPSEPTLAAQFVRRCACIDVSALAAAMAHNLSGSSTGKANGSRAGSRRQSIQDVSALGAAYGSNAGVGSTNGMLGGVTASCLTHGSYHLHGASLAPRGPACAVVNPDGSCAAPDGSQQCVQSSRQPSSQLSHSSFGSSTSCNLLQLSRNVLDHAAAQQKPLDPWDPAPHLSKSQLPPTYPCRSSPAPAGPRASHDATSRHSTQQSSPLPPARCGGGLSPHGGRVSPSPCSASSPSAESRAATKASAGTLDDVADTLPAAFDSPLRWPSGAVGSVACSLSGYGVPGMAAGPLERSSSCLNPSALASEPESLRCRGPPAMHHASSASVLPSCGLTAYDRDGAERHYTQLCPGTQDMTSSLYWGTGMPSAGNHTWSPGVSTRAHAAAGMYGPRAAASSSGHGGVVCCIPGACEALVAMGLANRLAGIGSDCDHPPDVCASRRVVFSWVSQEEVPQGASARGIRIIRRCAGGSSAYPACAAGGHNGLLSSATCGARAARASVDRCGVRGGRVLLLDELALRQEPPSVLVLPDMSELSDVERGQLAQALVEIGLLSPSGGPGGSCTVLSAACRTLIDVMDLILDLGSEAGEPQAASMLLERLQARLRRVMAATCAANAARSGGAAAAVLQLPGPAGAGRRPRVLVLQSLQPFVEPGRWVPEMLAMAGATACMAETGGTDVQLTWQDIRERAAPDVLIILTPPIDPEARAAPGSLATAPPGGSASQVPGTEGLQEQLALLAAQPGWWCLPAVRVSQVYLVQSTYCVRAGPRLVDGVELLARLLMPGYYSSSRKVPAGAVMRLSLAAGQRCRATLLSSYFVPMVFS